MSLTGEQLIANIDAMEAQGARPDEIQSYLYSFKGQAPAPTPTSETGSAGQTVLPGSNLKSNLQALPGAVKDVVGAGAVGALKQIVHDAQGIGNTLAKPAAAAIDAATLKPGQTPQ